MKNLPVEFTEGEEYSTRTNDTNNPPQDIEEVLAIIREARKPVEGLKLDGQFVGGSMDLDDDIDDSDIDLDIETSGDFVCAL